MATRKTVKGKAKKTGMSNHPLDQERARQKKVPTRGSAKEREDPHNTTGSQRGHRLSRKKGGSSTSQADASLVTKSAKGGKAGGTRAGLLSAGRKGKAGKGKAGKQSVRSSSGR